MGLVGYVRSKIQETKSLNRRPKKGQVVVAAAAVDCSDKQALAASQDYQNPLFRALRSQRPDVLDGDQLHIGSKSKNKGSR